MRIMAYSVSLRPDLAQIREMLEGLSKKLPKGATPILHSDQGWQYQHAEYQGYLKEHNIVQSMSRKGNCMDNGAMECFFGRLKVEMFYGEKFESVEEFIHKLHKYIFYWNNKRISRKLKGMSPVQYRTHYQNNLIKFFVQTLGFTSQRRSGFLVQFCKTAAIIPQSFSRLYLLRRICPAHGHPRRTQPPLRASARNSAPRQPRRRSPAVDAIFTVARLRPRDHGGIYLRP